MASADRARGRSRARSRERPHADFAHSFAPISDPSARILVLGSMPGKASLRASQYYANPQNLFWKLLGEVLGLEFPADYDGRIAALESSRIALWDVLESCTRASSLDSDIVPSSIVPNDFAAFFAAHRALRKVCFNGAAAAALFRRHVAPTLPAGLPLSYHPLPSTSPANASIAYAAKLRAWRVVGRT